MHWKLPADKNRVHKHNNIALSCETILYADCANYRGLQT